MVWDSKWSTKNRWHHEKVQEKGKTSLQRACPGCSTLYHVFDLHHFKMPQTKKTNYSC